MKKNNIFFGALVFLASFVAVLVFLQNNAYAYSNIYPDPSDNENMDIVLVTGEDESVRVMNKAKYAILAPAAPGGGPPKSQTINIVGANMCLGDTAGYDHYTPLYLNTAVYEGETVTTYSISTASGPKGQIEGKFYADTKIPTSAQSCTETKSLTFDFADADIDPEGSGYYRAIIDVNYIDQLVSWDNAQNSFYIYASNDTTLIGFAAEYNGYNVTQVRSPNDMYIDRTVIPWVLNPNWENNSNQTVYFSAPCTLMSNKNITIGLYDFDNNKTNPMREIDNPQHYLTLYISVYEYNEVNKTWNQLFRYAPDDISSDYQSTQEFVVRPNGKYKVVFEDVYWTNVLQYSIPFNQSPGCPVSPTPTNISINVPDYEKGSGIVKKITVHNNNSCPSSNVNITVTDSDSSINSTFSVACGGSSSFDDIGTGGFDIISPGDVVNIYRASYSGVSVSGESRLYEVPYTRFYGNDIYASGCDTTDTKNGKIVFNTKEPTQTSVVNQFGRSPGSAVEYAAFAYNLSPQYEKPIINSGAFNKDNVFDFYGLKVRLGAGANSLTMPNRYQCPGKVYDTVYDNRPTTSTSDVATIVNLSSDPTITNKTYYNNESTTVGGDITVSGTIGINNDKKVTIFSKGNVIINGDAGVDGYSPTDHEKASVVLIVAEGDVFIKSNVTKLGAIIVAKGTIYTCSDDVGGVALSALHPQCANQLVVSGALIAKDIKFGRVGGTRLLAGDYEQHTVTAATNLNGHAAEQIYYPYYLYFTSPYLQTGAPNQALYNLAPLF